MKNMTKAERIYEATRRECKDIITGIHGYSEGQRLSGLVTEEVVCMRTINAIMKLVDKEEHCIRLDEKLGVLSGEKLQLYINVNKMVRSTVENAKKSLKKFLDDLKPDSEYSKWLDERVEAMEAQESAEVEKSETTAPEAEQTAETVETEIAEKVIMRLSDDDGNVLGVKIFVGTYKQADEEAERIMAETGYDVNYVRYTESRWNWMSKEYYCGTDSESALTIVSPIIMKIEQTENNAESVSETYGVEDVKADTSKADKLSGATKMLMVFSPVVSEYLRQIEYIDTS